MSQRQINRILKRANNRFEDACQDNPRKGGKGKKRRFNKAQRRVARVLVSEIQDNP